ncbi:MAG TPA: Ran-binding zinc finger domain-containing protein [Longimicrobiaceae bacterium]
MAVREGRWDCPTCGTTGVRGRFTVCRSCGTPRPEGVRFYLPGDEPEVTEAELLRQAGAGADWICEHCGSSTRALEEECSGCGAPRGSSPEQDTHEYGLDDVPRSGEAPRPAASLAPPPSTFRRSWIGKAFRWGLGVGVVAAGVAVAVPNKVPVTVTGKTWERTVQVERERTVREEDWSVPSGGREVRHWRAVHHYDRVLDHYETRTRQVSDRVQTGTETYTCGTVDNGNGYFSDKTCTRPTYETVYRTETYEDPVYRQEPRYQTKYAYDIERWLPERVARAAGSEDAEPEWPGTGLKRKEREGARKEVYTLTFRDEEGKSYSKEIPRAQWDRHRPGETVTLKVFTASNFEIVEPDTAAAAAP